MRLRFALFISLLAPLGVIERALAQVVERPIPGDPITVDGGQVEGQLTASGVKSYLGLRFASAPVRELRWQPPLPPPSWRGIYHADRKMPECIQVLRAHNINHYFGEEATSEDCLYLNVWAPTNAKLGDNLPVIVFIYGGGWTIGSSGMALYGGEQVAHSGAIFVNFNYRVGALGFMAHPELTAESPRHASGNYGYLDQIAALQWIQRNIAKFGGDPRKVIVSGQSAGAYSASLLQASPLTKGLFRGVVAMSGGAWNQFGRDTATLDAAEAIGLQVQAALKVKSLAELRQLPADRILAVQQDCQLGCSGSIRIGTGNLDGYFLPATPAQLFAEHRHNDVPAIVGFTRDESMNELRSVKSLSEFRETAGRVFGEQGAAFLKLYPAGNDSEARSMGLTAAREGMVERGARNWAITQSKSGKAPTYLFMFSRVHPFNENVEIADHPERIGAYHTSDVSYWLQTQDALNLFRPTRNWTDVDRALARKMTATLVAFAATGNPSINGIHWQEWNSTQERLIEFGEVVQMQPMQTARLNFHIENKGSYSQQSGPRPARD